MKLACQQSDLNTHLSLVSRAVPSRPTHPVLGNILLIADEQRQRVQLTAFDLSLGIRTSFSAQVSEAGTLTLPAKLLNDIVTRLPEGELTLLADLADEPGGSVISTLISASGRFQVVGMGADEFPDLPVIATGDTLPLPIAALVDGLQGVLFAASADETKQVLTGVHLTRSQDSLEFAATDGHRLAVVQTTSVPAADEEEETEAAPPPSVDEGEDFSATIPARALRELERMLSLQQDTDAIALMLDEGQVAFELGDQRLTSRKIEGAYPAYQNLIPGEFSRTVTVDRKRLLSSLELVAVLADQKNNLVKFTIDSDRGVLSLSVEAQEIGNAQESIPAQITGDSLEIAFNVKYLMDGLKSLAAAEIQLQLNEATQPVIFTPLGSVKMTYLVMPVQIRD